MKRLLSIYEEEKFMKRLLAITVIFTLLLSMASVPAFAANSSNFKDFEDGVIAGGAYWTAGSPTIVEEEDGNHALKIVRGDMFRAANSTEGKIAIQFDFKIPTDFEDYHTLLKFQMKPYDGASYDTEPFWCVAKGAEGYRRTWAPATGPGGDDIITNAQGGMADNTWHTMKIVVKPNQSGNTVADVTIIRNRDVTNPANIFTKTNLNVNKTSTATGYGDQLLEVINFAHYSGAATDAIYIDNVDFYPATNDSMALASASPAIGASNVALKNDISLTFNNAVDAYALKINGADAAFTKSDDGKTLTFKPALAYNTTYTVTGLVSDGLTYYSVNYSFTTAKSFFEDFEDSAIDTSRVITSGAVEYVTMPTTANANNIALKLSSYAMYRPITTGLPGSIGYELDFMIPSDFPGYGQFMYLEGDSAWDSANLFMFSPSINGGRRVTYAGGCTLGGEVESGIDLYTGTELKENAWHKLKMNIKLNPAGVTLADIMLIIDGDETNPDKVHTLTNVKIPQTATTVATNNTNISKVNVAPRTADATVYVDNIDIYQIDGNDFSLTSATPAKGATDVALDTPISFTFNRAVSTYSVTINGEPATVTMSADNRTLTVADTLDFDTEYVVKGVANDGESICAFGTDFTTLKKGISTKVPVKYNFDFDSTTGTVSGLAETKVLAGDTNNTNVIVMKGNTADSCEDHCWDAYSSWKSWDWASADGNKMEGNIALSFDLKIDESTPLTATPETLAVTLGDGFHGGMAVDSYRLLRFVYNEETSKWDIRFRNDEDRYETVDSVAAGEWTKVSIVVHPTKGTYTAYAADGTSKTFKVRTDHTFGDGTSHMARKYVYQATMLNTGVGATYYFDNFTMGKHLSLDRAYFANAQDEVIDSLIAKPIYKAILFNNSGVAENVTFAMVAQKENGAIEDMVIKTVTVPAYGSLNIEEQFSSDDVTGCKIKAFYIKLKTLAPYSVDELPLISLGIN